MTSDGAFVVVSSSSAGAKTKLHAAWLLDNCLSRRHETGQRSSNLFNERTNGNVEFLNKIPKISSAVVVKGTEGNEELEVTFSSSADKPSEKATVLIATIEKFYFKKNYPSKMIAPPHLTCKDQIHRVEYAPFTAHLQLGTSADQRDGELFKKGTKEHFEALKRLALDGIIVVTGCGTGEEVATTVASAVGSFTMPTLYGMEWHVASAPREGSKNIAYTAAHLDLHQDLAYHESMPGIQLLHCQKFKDSVVGGNTFFVDAIAVAEEFRAKHPQEFDVFTKVPVAFMKDDFDRPLPAQYYYATPHIVLNDRQEITKVFWAPSFEAPAPIDGDKAAAYYKARAVFCDLLHEFAKKNTLSLRLKEGECVVWQQVRVWHGRESFTETEPESRVLHGAYANIDQFRCNVVAKGVLHGDPSAFELVNFLNRSYR